MLPIGSIFALRAPASMAAVCARLDAGVAFRAVTADSLLFAIAFCAAPGAGLMAGLFFAFSVSVMKALGEGPAAEGMAAMQANGHAWLFAGGALYLIGGFLVTVLFNVPRNNALARIAAADPQSARLWSDYLATWTAWNHVRTAASLAAPALLIMGLR